MAAAAPWVIDDAYWHREPGTTVVDHVAGGLVPVALAALLALVYPRLRPGALEERTLASNTTRARRAAGRDLGRRGRPKGLDQPVGRR